MKALHRIMRRIPTIAALIITMKQPTAILGCRWREVREAVAGGDGVAQCENGADVPAPNRFEDGRHRQGNRRNCLCTQWARHAVAVFASMVVSSLPTFRGRQRARQGDRFGPTIQPNHLDSGPDPESQGTTAAFFKAGAAGRDIILGCDLFFQGVHQGSSMAENVDLAALTVTRQELATLLGLSSARVGQLVGMAQSPRRSGTGATCWPNACAGIVNTRADSRARATRPLRMRARNGWQAGRARPSWKSRRFPMNGSRFPR